MELMQAHHQWAERPDDERFLSLTDLHAHCSKRRAQSKGAVVSSRKLEAITAADPFVDTKSLAIVGPDGNPAAPTHWAFGQLAQRVGAPAGYLRTMPALLAADCINYGLKVNRDVEDLGVLLYKNGGPAELSAVTGPNYGRIWNSDITGALVKRFGNGTEGEFRVPVEFGSQGGAHPGVTKENTTLYAGDRDMFVFLADEERRIRLPNRRGGKTGDLARGFFMWNSEQGKCVFGIGMFLFDFMCGNHIVWGAEGYEEVRIRHTSSAPEKWISEVTPMLHAYAKSSVAPIQARLMAAQQRKIDDVQAFLMSRFTRPQVSAIIATHQLEEARPIETLWDAATGVTAYARGIAHMDARVEIEREAGRIIDMAA